MSPEGVVISIALTSSQCGGRQDAATAPGRADEEQERRESVQERVRRVRQDVAERGPQRRAARARTCGMSLPFDSPHIAFCKLLGQYFYQVALNGSRLGLYEPFRRWANTQLGYSPTQQVVLTSMGAGSVSAVVGCASSCHFLAMCSLIFLSILGQPALPRQDTHASVLSSTSCRCTTILSAWVGRAANYRPRRGCQGLASGLGRCDSAGGDRGLGMCVVFAFFEC